MIEPPIPANEARRLAALHALRILDTPSEERFDRITRIAQKLFDVPIALVSLVDSNRQWFKSHLGLSAHETPRNISFCGHAILQTEPMVVTDATLDPRFSDNPLVIDDPEIRFYAGQPLSDIEGNRLGTLCIIDRRPREIDEVQLQLLHDLRIWVENELNTASIGNVMRRLSESEKRFRTVASQAIEATAFKQSILDSANYSIIATDSDGTIRSINQTAQVWLGYTTDEVVGRVTPEIIHDREEVAHRARALSHELGRPILPGFEVFVAKAQLSIPDENDWTYVRKDGARFPVHLSVTAQKNAEGKIIGFLGIAHDISAQQRAIRERDNFFNLSLDMLCIADFNGYFTHINPAWELTLGYSVKELRSSPFIEFVHPEDRDNTIKEAEKLYHGGITVDFENRYRCKNGDYKWLSWSATADLEEKLLFAVARDNTESKRIEQMRKEFVSTVSHELRTPLTSIRGSLGLVAGGVAGDLPEKAEQLIDIAHKNCERLVLLINDILDSEKIDSGKMTFESKPVEMVKLVQQALEANQPYAAQFGVDIAFEPADSEVSIKADPIRLMQVMNNLISNATKFSPPHSKVGVTLERRGGKVRVSISDQGPGIAPEFKDRIFQRFSQADASDSRLKGGTGLGLSIAKTIIDRQGGNIDFISEPGRGATFYFEFPVLTTLGKTRKTAKSSSPRGKT